MLICGIKVTHDAAVAVIDKGRLLFSIELEKLANGRRYSELGDLDKVTEILRREGLDPRDVDEFVIDGWWGEEQPVIDTKAAGKVVVLPVAGYQSRGQIFERGAFEAFDFHGRGTGKYASYSHAAHHVATAYCPSPFAQRGEDSLVLIWDGGMVPRLFQVDANAKSVKFLGPVNTLVGNMFSEVCAFFEPFTRPGGARPLGRDRSEDFFRELETAGKAMAYAALGRTHDATFPVFDELLRKHAKLTADDAYLIGDAIIAGRDELFPGLSNADIISSWQDYLGRRLLDGLTQIVHKRFPNQTPNLAFSGGCALNIKWNNRLRASGLFRDIFIPPFTNDSGAAIGQACCEMFVTGKQLALEWDVFSGPKLDPSTAPGWSTRPCDERGVAEILHREGEVVVVLDGRAELGPRALGNRSMLAPAVDTKMKDRLNDMKKRAAYRPVAPIALASRAPEVFDPGTPDPYMLFEHYMRPGWEKRIPAIVHLDNSARLQTLDETSNTVSFRILTEYEKLSGIPVLCNTSANLNGHGFFPDVATAAEWGQSKYIWSDGVLYTKP